MKTIETIDFAKLHQLVHKMEDFGKQEVKDLLEIPSDGQIAKNAETGIGPDSLDVAELCMDAMDYLDEFRKTHNIVPLGDVLQSSGGSVLMPTTTQIVDQLKAWDKAYYNDEAKVPDATYDKLRDHLKSVDPDNPYLKTVGAPVDSADHREDVQLAMHMGSQNKAKDETEAKDWYDKYDQPEVIVSDKQDGSSAEVLYEDGQLVRVATRGDGITGLDITRNGKLWRGLPQSINVKGQCIVRGEAQMSVSTFNAKYPNDKNPRNTGNGICVCDSDGERNEDISFKAFDIVHPEVEFKAQSHKFKALKALGFDTARWFRCKTWEELEKCRAHYEKDRPTLDFEIDGMVVAIEDLAVQAELGFSDGGTRPRGQIAWKFDTEKAITKVTGMVLTIGHTGKIIPKATLEPIQLAGTTVSNVLLNNFDYIENLDLNVGDEIEMEKGGDIIPHCTRVVTKHTTGPYPAPTHWKAKDGKDYPLVKEGTDWKVVDEDCPDLVFKRVKNWIDKLKIKQLGDSALEAIIDSHVVEDIDDLYKMTAKRIETLIVGKSVIGGNAKKIVKEIDKTREIDIANFMGSMSIKHLGRSRCSLLEDLKTVDDYLNLTISGLTGKPCSEKGTYSAEVAAEVVASIQARADLIRRVSKVVAIKQPRVVTSTALKDVFICFTGCRPSPALEDSLLDNSATVLPRVTKECTHLVTKDKTSTSSKTQKAQKYGAEIIEMIDLEEMLMEVEQA